VAWDRYVAPSVELEAAIERLLAKGLANAVRLAEIKRLALTGRSGRRWTPSSAGRGTSGRRRRGAGGTATGQVDADGRG